MSSHITSPASPVPFRREMEFAYGRCDQLSPLVRRVIANNPSPFTFHGTGTYIIGSGEVAVIDPGPDMPEHIDAILAALAPGERVSHIFITHTHSDHCPGARPLKEKTGAIIYGMRLPKRAHPQGVVLEEGVDEEFVPDISLTHGQVIAHKNWTLEALHTPGHIANHFCFALQEERTVFCGDHIMAWATTIIAPPDGNLADYFRSLDLLLKRTDQLYWPTHGPCIDKPQDFVRSVRRHREWRNQNILDCLKSGPSTRQKMVTQIYADIDKQLHPAAEKSLEAHLEYLLLHKKIACDTTTTPPRYYIAAASKSAR